MAAEHVQLPSFSRPIAIAPAPTGESSSTSHGATTMSHACQSCAKRKVKCDKIVPTCSSCRRSKLQCSYEEPPPRQRKRKLSGDVLERLARYECILRDHGLLDASTAPSKPDKPRQGPIYLLWNEPGNGKLFSDQGKSRYTDTSLWRNLESDEMYHLPNDEEEEEGEDDQDVIATSVENPGDPLTGAFIGFRQNLLRYHPTHAKAMILWETHIENVEPLCKILHIPSTRKMIEMVSQQPETATKIDECLLFAIYHFAIFSMTEEECAEKIGQPRATLLQRYHFVARQALVNASFLKATDMSILQALVLFLIPCRHSYDSNTYWILTGVAVRLAQRMGLHRDGEKLGMSPFDVQMRRRLFYQLLPLEGIASQMVGVQISPPPDTWNTQQPLNINDDQIWPGMTEAPKEQKGATEMLFCLSRSSIGRFFAKAGKPANSTGPSQFKDLSEADEVIRQAESEVEEKYVRYCDIVNPLHTLTIGMVRAGIAALRLRTRLPKARNKTATGAEMIELFQLARKILETDIAVYAHAGIRKYRWHVRSFFLWGTWDSLIFILTSLWTRSGWLSIEDTDAAWSIVQQLYHNHGELLESKRALHAAFRRLTLNAWDARPPSTSASEPAFIKTLCSQRQIKTQGETETHRNNIDIFNAKMNTISPPDSFPIDDVGEFLNKLPENIDINIGNDFDMNATDWVFWDQLIQDHQTQNS
ncbi:mitogen-activated protein kinase [Hypoxylon trugodes]|uniref:mitogen-activated protein kinase n=1 Tax=Hypoxylon trugodes TaxID=326681 RepID=UPI00218D14C4|nr:mitogen-activated protein kinase [Hypoxylon trugodes]KAI1383437.1 mitogen-activated protein kinase [Hypoxylon trugodes]